MTQRYYIHPLRISHTYTVCFDHIHAPSSTSNSPWTHIFFCFRILQTPLPPNILLPTPRFLKKIPRSTISAAHTAYVSGASHGAWRHTSDPKEKWFSHPERLQLPTAPPSGMGLPEPLPQSCRDLGGLLLTSAHTGLARVTIAAP